METRVALIGIVVENPDSVEQLNAILHQYREYVIGREQKVPMTNYGTLIAYINGILKRSVAPLPEIAGMIDEWQRRRGIWVFIIHQSKNGKFCCISKLPVSFILFCLFRISLLFLLL